MANYVYAKHEVAGLEDADTVVLCDKCAKRLSYQEFEQQEFAPADLACEGCGGFQTDKNVEDIEAVALAELLALTDEGEVEVPVDNKAGVPGVEEIGEFIDHANEIMMQAGTTIEGMPGECAFTEKALVTALLETFPVLGQVGGVPGWDVMLPMTHLQLHQVAHIIARIAYSQGYVDAAEQTKL